MIASAADIHIRKDLRNEVWRHILFRGWVGPLSVLWAFGFALLITGLHQPALAAVWSAVAIVIAAAMTANELRSSEVARLSLAAAAEHKLRIADLGSVQDTDHLRRNIGTFAEIGVRIRAAGPKRLKDAYRDRAFDNMIELLSKQAKEAHEAEDTWELELSPDVCAAYAAAWRNLNERALDVASPRFPMEFARATNEMRTGVTDRAENPVAPPEQPHAPENKTLVRETHLALRNLANPARLAQSPLIEWLPCTLEAARNAAGSLVPPSMTLLDKAKLLRVVITVSIDRLGSDGSGPGKDSIQHLALKERYVLGRPIKAILTRHTIAETTFHHHRQAAISALAMDLAVQEENLSRQGRGGA